MASILGNADTNTGSPDQAYLENKVDAGLYWAEQAAKSGVDIYDANGRLTDAANASAHGIIETVTSDPGSVGGSKGGTDDFFHPAEPQPEPEPEPQPGGGGGGSGGGGTTTFTIIVDDNGVVSFGGNATGIIEITKFKIDSGTAEITASRGGISKTIIVQGFGKIEAGAGQNLKADAAVISGGHVNLTNGATLAIATSFPTLDADIQALPLVDISGVSVGGYYNMEAVWDSINVSSGQPADKFKLFWNIIDNKHYLDFPESYNDHDLYFARIFLAEQYVEYLHTGPAIVDIVQTKVGGTPNFTLRQQSLHDNILAELMDESITDKRPAGYSDEPRSEAGLTFGDRPYAFGDPATKLSEADKWDALHGVNRADLEKTLVNIHDASLSHDGPETLTIEWATDRAELKSITYGEDSDHNVVYFNVEGEGATEGFYRYQGSKFAIKDATNSDQYLKVAAPDVEFHAKFYFDPAWDNDDIGQQSGIWIQLHGDNTEPGNGFFHIIEFMDREAITASDLTGFSLQAGDVGLVRFFDEAKGGWTDYQAIEDSGWIDLKYTFEDGNGTWSINDNKAHIFSGTKFDGIDYIESVIFNSQNYGHDQYYGYSDVSLSGISLNELFY